MKNPIPTNSGLPPDNSMVSRSIQTVREEYLAIQALYAAQPPAVQAVLDEQGLLLAADLIREPTHIHFLLPERVVMDAESGQIGVIPVKSRAQTTGGVIDRLAHADIRTAVRVRLTELESSARQPLAAGARLLRYATAYAMVHTLLPTGEPVKYGALDGDTVPTEPAGAPAAAEDLSESQAQNDAPNGHGFFLPGLVCVSAEGKLLVGTSQEADARLAEMQMFLHTLHAAIALAPYFVADAEYQRKRYGMLGQLLHQGRALARYETQAMIEIIAQRAAANDLNRGLSLSVPYFDDQILERRTHDFVVIQAGRFFFLPAFVVTTAREEQAKVAQDTRLSPSTRRTLIQNLRQLESAFTPS